MAHDEQTRIANDFLDAFNTADWTRFRARLAPDVAYEETGTGRRTEGADAYVALCQGWKAAFPDAAGALHRAVSSGDTVVQEVTWEGTQRGDLPTPGGTIPASGKQIAVAGTLWLTLRDGRATAISHHLDLLTMLQQLGAIPAAAA
jgi:steroid delta-isomerase-like uncharacterized protein